MIFVSQAFEKLLYKNNLQTRFSIENQKILVDGFAVDLRNWGVPVLGTQVGKIYQSRTGMKFTRENFMKGYNLCEGDFEIN